MVALLTRKKSRTPSFNNYWNANFKSLQLIIKNVYLGHVNR